MDNMPAVSSSSRPKRRRVRQLSLLLLLIAFLWAVYLLYGGPRMRPVAVRELPPSTSRLYFAANLGYPAAQITGNAVSNAATVLNVLGQPVDGVPRSIFQQLTMNTMPRPSYVPILREHLAFTADGRYLSWVIDPGDGKLRVHVFRVP